MNKVLEPQSIESYLEEAQTLKIISTSNPKKLEKLLEFVLKQKDNFEGSPEVDFLFKGEHAFHSGNYEQALVNYMQAREVPSFEFFCYRATAYVSFLRGDFEKAKSFILKVLDFRPLDYDTLKLYHEILTQQGNQEQAKEIKDKINMIENENPENESLIENSPTPSLFDDNTEKKEKSELDYQQTFINEEFSSDFGKTELDTDSTSKDATGHEGFSFESPAGSESLPHETTSQFIATKLGVDLDTEKALETRIQEFQQNQTKQIQGYLEESQRKKNTKDSSLYILNGWSSRGSKTEQRFRENTLASDILLMEQSRQISGGFFIRWNDMGIVINPGTNFLENFHKQGLYIGDINYVIVTRDCQEANADIKRIYDLNYQLNKVSPELHVINYYLNHKAYQDLTHTLKPNFKQERNTVHSLELFLDSPDVESEELAEGIALSYFSTSSRGGYLSTSELGESTRTMQSNCVGIRLDLSNENSADTIRLGYVSGTAWSPLLAHHLGHCDILVTGFGTTNPNDYGKLNYNENSLGYFGTYTLFEEVKPKLLLCAEFDGREGDIRLEVAKKLRTEYQKANSSSPFIPSILPADNGLYVDLKTQQIECSISKTLLDPSEIVVVKSSGTYGKLQYLSPTCIL